MLLSAVVSRGARSLVRNSSTMAPVVVASVHGSAGVATLNRPKVLNSLDLEMIHILAPQIKAWEEDREITTIITRGAGGKAYCAGGDVVAVAKAGREDVNKGLEFFGEEYKVDYLIANLKKPYVALIDGIVMGGGVGISVHGKFRVCTERSLFAMPETQIGLFPDVGGSYFLPKLQGGMGNYLALTGNRLKGGDLLHAGIATHYVESERLDELVEAVGRVTDAAEVANTLDQFSGTTETASFAEFQSDIDDCFSRESVQAIIKALEENGSEWASKQLSTLRRMSPVSVMATFEQLKRGKDMSLAECLQMEYGMCHRSLLEPDFYEGIRAQLVDKDRNPKWSVARVEDVDEQDLIEKYFNPINHLTFKI